MQSPFTQQVISIIAAIPFGKVSTYGIIARHGGNRSGARQVARILHSSSEKYHLPWHRVINRNGRISLPPGAGYEMQKELLLGEGIKFQEDDSIDFELFLWWPGCQSNNK